MQKFKWSPDSPNNSWKNGSGKSILLSNIVDAFYELADLAYENATKLITSGHQYYKEIGPA